MSIELNLSSSNLKELPEDSNLTEEVIDLDLSGNKLFLDLRGNQIKNLDEVDLKWPNTLKTLYIGRNQIQDILQPRYLHFLEQLQNVDLKKNPFTNKLQKSNIDQITYLLFLLGNKLKKINNVKITKENYEKADKIIQLQDKKQSQALADKILMMAISEDEVLAALRSNSFISNDIAANQSYQVERSEQKQVNSPGSIYTDITSFLAKDKSNKKPMNISLEDDKKEEKEKYNVKDQMMILQMNSMKNEIMDLKQSLKTLEDKYDIDILVKNQQNYSLKYNNKGQILEFLKIDQIQCSQLRKTKALPKSEYKIAKIQALIRGIIIRKRFKVYLYQQKQLVKLQAFFRGVLQRIKLKKLGIYSKLKQQKQEQTCCQKCIEHEKDMMQMMQKISTMTDEMDDLKKQKVQHEKALRYLFDQVSQLRQSLADQ